MSSFLGFDVTIDKKDGTFAPVAGAVVAVRDVTDADPVTGAGAVALADVVADGAGHVASGELAVAAGRRIRFTWVRALDGRCGSIVRVTT
jgi:hypothetical protein